LSLLAFVPGVPCAADEAGSPELRLTFDGSRVTSIRNLLTGESLARGAAAHPWPPDGPQPSLRVTPLDDGSLQLTALPAAEADPADVRLTLGPFEAGSDPTRPSRLRVITPMFDGMVLDERATQWTYPLGNMQLPLLLLDTGAGGLCLWPAGDDNYVSITVTRSQLGLAVAVAYARPRLLSGEPLPRSVPWRLAAYAGDWRRGADRYAAWLERDHGYAPLAGRPPAWLTRIRGIARLTQGDSDLLTGLLSRLAERVDPATVLVYYPNWRQYPYDVRYPDYTPSEDAVRVVTAARRMGFHVMVHGNFAGISPDDPGFPSLRPFGLLAPSGEIIKGAPDICQLNPAFPPVRERLIQAYVASHDQLPFDALHLDFPALVDGPRAAADQLSPRAGARPYLQALSEALPGVALGTEWLDDGLLRHCSFSQQPWMVNADEDVTPHPVGRYLLGRYRHLYAHLSTPNQNGATPYGALVWFLRLGELGGLPTLTLGGDFDPDAPVAAILVRAIRDGLPLDEQGRAAVPGVVYGSTAAVAPTGFGGWVAQEGDRAFGLDPASAYLPGLPGSTPPTPGAFRLTRCSLPVRVVGGADDVRGYVHLEPAPGSGWTDLVTVPPWRRGTLVDGVEGPLSRGGAYQPELADAGGRTRRALFAHPPWRVDPPAERLAIFAEYRLAVPSEGEPRLIGFLGLRDVPDGGEPGDGVVFSVHVNGERVWQRAHAARRWEPFSVPLDPWRGRTVLLRLVTDAGPKGDTGYDWGLWGEPRVVARAGAVVELQDARRPVAVVVQDADGARLADPDAHGHTVELPATILHVYEARSLPATGLLLDLPPGVYYSFGGAVTGAEGRTIEGSVVRQTTVEGRAARFVSCHPPFEGQAHREWLVDLPSGARSLSFKTTGDNPHKRFEVWINGEPRWQSSRVPEQGKGVTGRVDLTAEAGKPTLITLVVDSAGSNHFDSASFIEPTVSLTE